MKTILTFIAVTLIQLSGFSDDALAQNVEDRRYACMMQDSLQVKPGVPIEYGGKTYYGCCPMCAEKMKGQPDQYLKSKDPVSHATVDKATALLYAHQGTIFYFESEANRKMFSVDPTKFLQGMSS
jgi:YHS domain-containing protein